MCQAGLGQGRHGLGGTRFLLSGPAEKEKMVAQLNGKIVLVAEADPARWNVLGINGEASIVPTGYDGVTGLGKCKGLFVNKRPMKSVLSRPLKL